MKYLAENCGELGEVGTDMYNITLGYNFVSLSCCLYYFENTVERIIHQNFNTSLWLCGFFLCFSANIINVSS